MCERCHLRPIFRRESQSFFARFDCGTWACPECGPRRRAHWRNFAEKLAETDDAFEVTIVHGRKAEEAAIARLHRANSEFLKVRTAAGILIFHQAFRGNRLRAADSGRWFDKTELLRRVDEAFDLLEHRPGMRTITVSGGLRRKKDKTPSAWQLIGYAPQSLTTVNKILADAGHQPIYHGKLFRSDLLELFLVKPRKSESSSAGSKTKIQNRQRTTSQAPTQRQRVTF